MAKNRQKILKVQCPADKQDIAGFLEFLTKNKVPKNRTQYASKVLSKKTREER